MAQTGNRAAKRMAEVRDVVIEGQDGQVITMAAWDGAAPPATKVRLTDGLKSSLAAAIRPGMEVMSHAQAARNAYTVVFAPRVAEGLANQTMTLVQGEKGFYLTAMEHVVNRNGKTVQRIAGNGQLVANNVQRVAHLSMAAMQIAAVVTAQAYLADIDRKLTAIQEGVSAIQEWLENKEWSRLHANHEYLQGIAEAIRTGGLNDIEVGAYLNQIEQIERDSLEIASICVARLHSIRKDLPDIRTSFRTTGVREDMARLDGKTEEWRRFAAGYMAAQQLRMVALHLRDLLAPGSQVTGGRMQAVHRELSVLQPLWQDFSTALASRAAAVDSYIDRGLSAAERREFRKRLTAAEAGVMSRLETVHDFHASTEKALRKKRLADETGLALLVSTDASGSITDLARITLHPEPV